MTDIGTRVRGRVTGLVGPIVARVAERVSRGARVPSDFASAEVQEGHRRSQRLAFDCAVTIGAELREGDSEKAIAKRMQAYLSDHGATTFFHRPFAWFGGHSRFDGYRTFHDYHPSARTLGAHDLAVLDLAPILDGFMSDISHTVALGPSPALARAQAVLRELRDVLPRLFTDLQTPGEVWRAADRWVTERGFDNLVVKLPYQVFGHRLYRVDHAEVPTPMWVSRAFLPPLSDWSWLSWQALAQLTRKGVWRESITAAHAGTKLGLWSIEMHLGWAGAGAKSEEILVVHEAGADWLDDDVPLLAAQR